MHWVICYLSKCEHSQPISGVFCLALVLRLNFQPTCTYFIPSIYYLKLYLLRQLVYTDCTLTLPASCLVFTYFLLCVSVTTYSANKFDLLDRKTANCAAAILTSLRGDLISSKIHFFSFFFFFYPPFFLFTSWRIVSQRGLLCLAQLYRWWAAVIQQRLLNRSNSPGWNTLQRTAIYRIGVRAVFQGPAAVAAH